jgi:uncharacterized protein (TIGR04255 family)
LAWRVSTRNTRRVSEDVCAARRSRNGLNSGIDALSLYNETETRFVAIAPNSLAFGSTQYPGWQAFREEFLKHWSALKDALQPAILTRIGMRFTNAFQAEATDENDSGDILAQVRFENSYLKVLAARPTLHQSVTSFQRGKHQIAVQTLLQEGGAELIIGYDFAVVNAAPDEVERIIEELHKDLEEEFSDQLRRI